MADLFPNARLQFDTALGLPNLAGKLYTYAAGTNTPKTTWQDQGQVSANTNPIILDARGECQCYGNGNYKFVLQDALGNTIWTQDNVNASISTALAAATGASLVGADDGAGGSKWTTVAGFIAYLLSSIGSSVVGFIRSDPGAVVRNVQDKLRDLTTPQDFGVTVETTSQAIGTSVLQLVTSGIRNTGFGFEALQSNTDGSENTAFGYRALSGVIGGVDPAGDYNSAFGSFALASVTTGSKNAAFGRASADNLTSGGQNTALGYGSLHWGTTAQNCVAVGFEAVHGGSVGPVTAQGIVGIGFHALYECLGDFNTAVGTSALAFLTTGVRNTGIGTNALNQQTTASDCVGVGYGAGVTNTGSGNLFLGAGADANAGRANVTVIGTSMTATTDNVVLLGNGQTVIPGTTAADLGSAANPWNFGIFDNSLYAHRHTAIPAGGANGKGFLLSSTSNFGIFFGSGAPTLTAAKGSLYLRSDGSTTTSRAYINTDGGTTWTALTTVA